MSKTIKDDVEPGNSQEIPETTAVRVYEQAGTQTEFPVL